MPAYQVRVGQYPIGTSPSYSSAIHFAACCTYGVQLTPGFHYVVSVRAHELLGCAFLCYESSSLWRTVQFDAVSLPVVDF